MVKMVMMLLPGNRWAAMQEPQPPSLVENVNNSSFVLYSFLPHCGFVFFLYTFASMPQWLEKQGIQVVFS